MTYNIPQHISGDTWKGINTIQFIKNNIPIDLTNAYVEFGVKLSNSSPETLTLSTQNSGIDIFSPLEGKLRILSRIVDIPVGKYSWYITLNTSDNNKKTYLMGLWPIVPNIPLVTEYERRNYN
jgi:hypothetical protein